MERGAAAGTGALTPTAAVNGAPFLCKRQGEDFYIGIKVDILKCGNFLLTFFWSQGAFKQLLCKEGQSKEP